MIKIEMNDQVLLKGRNSANPFVDLLDEWRDWIKPYGFIYVPAGSQVVSLPRKGWCVQRYSPTATKPGLWHNCKVCFHPDDSNMAVLFKLRWGGS